MIPIRLGLVQIRFKFLVGLLSFVQAVASQYPGENRLRWQE